MADDYSVKRPKETNYKYEAYVHAREYAKQLAAYKFRNRVGLIARIHGCHGGCPYKGTAKCPYGVGVKTFEGDVMNKDGIVIRKRAEVIDTYIDPSGEVKGICPEVIAETQEMHSLASSVSGLRLLRSQSMERQMRDIATVREKLQERLAAGSEVLIEDEKSGDLKIVEALKELHVMESKFGDKIEAALALETKVVDQSARKISADDINEQIKKARAIDVKE